MARRGVICIGEVADLGESRLLSLWTSSDGFGVHGQTQSHDPEVKKNPRIQFLASHLQTFSRWILHEEVYKTWCKILKVFLAN